MPSILLNRMLAGKVVENHFCNFPHYHNPTPPPPHHHHLPPPPTPHHHHPPPPPPPQDVSGQSDFLESADKCTTASKPTHMIIVRKDDDDDNDDSDDSEDVINDDPNCTANCTTTSKPTHTLIVHEDDDTDDNRKSTTNQHNFQTHITHSSPTMFKMLVKRAMLATTTLMMIRMSMKTMIMMMAPDGLGEIPIYLDFM